MTKLDEIQTCVIKTAEDVKEIRQVLAGNGFGNPGLVKDHQELKLQFYKMRDEVKKIRIIGGVLGAIVTVFIGIISIFK